MKLNDAIIHNAVVNGKSITSVKELADAIMNAKDLVADMYINDKLVTTSAVNMTENNGYMIAPVDYRFSLSECVSVDHISIQIRQANNAPSVTSVILESFTEEKFTIDAGDCDADIYFKVMSVIRNNTGKLSVPDTRFKPLRESKITPVVLDDVTQESPFKPAGELIEIDP